MKRTITNSQYTNTLNTQHRIWTQSYGPNKNYLRSIFFFLDFMNFIQNPYQRPLKQLSPFQNVIKQDSSAARKKASCSRRQDLMSFWAARKNCLQFDAKATSRPLRSNSCCSWLYRAYDKITRVRGGFRRSCAVKTHQSIMQRC